MMAVKSESLRVDLSLFNEVTKQFENVDGIEVDSEKASTTVSDLARMYFTIHNVLAAKVDGILVDLTYKICQSCKIQLFNFDNSEGRSIFWHSSAHILGNALVNLYNCKLVKGPAIQEGFFYDIDVDEPITEHMFKDIEKEMSRLIKKSTRFVREVMGKEELLQHYRDNEYKKYFIEKSVEKEATVYINRPCDRTSGQHTSTGESIANSVASISLEPEFLDLCRGPHINNTNAVKAIKILKSSSCYFLDDSKNKSLQRIYGISFPSKGLLKEYNERIARAKEMDHRKIGNEMDLFFFHEYSPGSCFWLPAGAHIYNKLMEFLRSEYRKRGFQEVISPNMYSIDLWKESGHYENYKENIYMIENEEFGLKPMNCPGHCVMFKNTEHSFKELPLRFADFGVLHRNECSGSLTGLTRVRRFQQDDAHIFCMRNQIESEIVNCLDFLNAVYKLFDFKYDLFLSTRPEKFMGRIEEWDQAEESLKRAILDSGKAFTLNEGDGAFYGPKIDIILYDALNRKTQCATIQLDFQLPQRFNLKFKATDGTYQTPVMIHRAICGSMERMIAIIVENYGKKLPFWLSPRQIALVSIYAEDYTTELRQRLSEFEVKVYDDKGDTLNKKIRKAEVDGYRVVCVLGRKEAENREINVRLNGGSTVSYGIGEFVEIMRGLVDRKMEFEEITRNK